VTDSQGRTDTATVLIEPTGVTTVAPAAAGSAACPTPIVSGPTPGAPTSPTTPTTPTLPTAPAKSGGGGGYLEFLTLLLLGLLTLRLALRR
jgi:hypothetical protein